VREAVQAVAVSHDAFALDIVEHGAHLFGRKLVMIEKRDEAGDGALEVDVVLPQRVVGVDEEGLERHALGSWLFAFGSHYVEADLGRVLPHGVPLC
jgi:hypothetical protein